MSRAPILHTETRVASLGTSSVVLSPTTPQSSASSFAAGRKRGFDEIAGLDEETYAHKYLATEGSVFFRRKQRTPRSFLWRVLDHRKVLEVHGVDPVHDTKHEGSEGGLAFRIQLPTSIVSNGVAFADPDESDALEVFILTTTNELYTVTLKRDLLARDTAPNDFDASTCLKKHASASLAFRHPYKLMAASSLELLVSLHDGGILRLTREPNENGAHWRETIYSEGNWSDTIRGLISLKRHQSVTYGNIELEPSAAAAMVKSPDGNYIWTVSLDHQLRAWRTEHGKPIASIDLLNDNMDDETRGKHPRYIMGAEQGTLMQLVTPPAAARKHSKPEHDGSYYLVVRSPKDNQFKFYEVSLSVDSDSAGLAPLRFNDLQPTTTLVPPLDEMMGTAMWHLEDFCIIPGAGWHDSQLWIRAREGKACRIFTLTFNMWNKKGELLDLEARWQTGWTAVDSGMQTTEALALCSDYPAEIETTSFNADPALSEKWLAFLSSPGRFSTASLETALNIYRKGRGLSAGSNLKGLASSKAPLQERMLQAVASKITLRRDADSIPDYDRYHASIAAEWTTFYALLRDLHVRRNESIGLAVDVAEGLAWSICADFSAPIRSTSRFEALLVNERLLENDAHVELDEGALSQIFPSDDVVYHGHVLSAAQGFSQRLPADFREALRNDLASRAIAFSAGDRAQDETQVQGLCESHDFGAHVMDDDYQALENAAQSFGGLGDLSADAILAVVDFIQHDTDNTGADAHRALTSYGDKLTVAIAQETLERNRRVLLDLLTLVIFMLGDLDRADLNANFVTGIGSIYEAILGRLKHHELLLWLSKNVVAMKERPRRASSPSQAADGDSHAVTLLERIFIGDWEPHSKATDSPPVQLTKWSKQWTYGADLWNAWDGVTGHILAFLIKQHAFDLAADFQPFVSQGEDAVMWLRYLEARLLLAIGQYADASLKFRASAEGMAIATQLAATDTAGLLSAEEQTYFGDGQSRFYQHVAALYEKLKVFSYAADFASTALEHLESGNDAGADSLAEIDRKKSMTDSPAHQRADQFLSEIDILKEYEKRKEELRIRLFTALVETGRFNEALDALTGINERPIRNANLATLVKACIEKDAIPTLLEMPFDANGLKHEVDTILLGLAKKSLASGSTTVPYHQILYAYRAQNSDFRGAAEIVYEYLEQIRQTQTQHGIVDPEEESLVQAYVLLINTLSCCGEENAWLLADSPSVGNGKRKLVTIADVRKQYAAELDKRSDILQGRFPLVEQGESMDVL